MLKAELKYLVLNKPVNDYKIHVMWCEKPCTTCCTSAQIWLQRSEKTFAQLHGHINIESSATLHLLRFIQYILRHHRTRQETTMWVCVCVCVCVCVFVSLGIIDKVGIFSSKQPGVCSPKYTKVWRTVLLTNHADVRSLEPCRGCKQFSQTQKSLLRFCR